MKLWKAVVFQVSMDLGKKECFSVEKKIREFENNWSEIFFNVKYSVSVNSNTSGLYAAMGAVGVSPGDEIIVPPITMSATAMCPLIYGGIPVFADLEDKTFCLDVNSVKRNITKKN